MKHSNLLSSLFILVLLMSSSFPPASAAPAPSPARPPYLPPSREPLYAYGYGDREYDAGFNKGYGYGRRDGANEAAYANYLAYYGITLYPRSAGSFTQADCLRACASRRRTDCPLICRRFG